MHNLINQIKTQLERAIACSEKASLLVDNGSKELILLLKELNASLASSYELLGHALENLESHIPNTLQDEQQLSEREQVVLKMLGEGKNTKQIAESLGIANSTAETYRERIKSKLHLLNSNDLNRYAVLKSVGMLDQNKQ